MSTLKPKSRSAFRAEASPAALIALSLLAMMIAGWQIHAQNAQVVPPIPGPCQETDNGWDEFTKGTVTGGTNTYVDYCHSRTQVWEYYCGEQIWQGAWDCQYGCFEGACLSEPAECIDTDGGTTFGMQGKAHLDPFVEIFAQDACFDNENSLGLREYYCPLGPWEAINIYESVPTFPSTTTTCPYGCDSGRCMTQQQSLALCGNGTKAIYEACDDGNKTSGDGCSSTCGLEGGWTCTGNTGSMTQCTLNYGDGIIVAGKETCDDGNTAQNDGCFNGVTDPNFACTGAPSVCKRTGVNGVPYSCKAFDADGAYVSGSFESSAAACWTKWANSGQLTSGWTVFYNNQPIDASVIPSPSPSSKSSSSASPAPVQAQSSSSKTSAPAAVQSSSPAAAVLAASSSKTSATAPATVIDIPVIQAASAASQPAVQSQMDTLKGAAPVKTYKDVPSGSAYYPAVTALSGLGIINGNPDGTFRPYDLVNRAETAKILMLALGVEIGNLQNLGRFWDVPEGEWYVPFVMRAAQLGVLEGYPDGSFGPTRNINRAEFLKMISLTFGTPVNLPFSYTDIPAGEWYGRYAGLAYTYNLFGTDTELQGAKAVTRGEIANAIYIILQAFPKK